MHGILKLRSMVHSDPAMGWRERYGAERTVEVLPDEGDELLAREAAEAQGRDQPRSPAPSNAVNVPAGDTAGA